MSREWFDKYHAHNSTPEFEAWWQQFYGDAADYVDENDDEYWVRKGFALMGWRGRSEYGK